MFGGFNSAIETLGRRNFTRAEPFYESDDYYDDSYWPACFLYLPGCWEPIRRHFKSILRCIGGAAPLFGTSAHHRHRRDQASDSASSSIPPIEDPPVDPQLIDLNESIPKPAPVNDKDGPIDSPRQTPDATGPKPKPKRNRRKKDKIPNHLSVRKEDKNNDQAKRET